MKFTTKMFVVGAATAMLAACATVEEEQVAAAPVAATEKTEMPAEETKMANADEEVDGSRVVCKRQIVTGSRFKEKICMTWDEWKRREELAKKTAGDLQTRGGQTNQRIPN